MKIVQREELAVGDMKDELLERKALPIGRTEFETWTDRIISGAAIPGADKESQVHALAHMIMHLAPTEAFKEDAYFILSLRKAAVNQTAHMLAEEIKKAREAKSISAKDTAKTSGVGLVVLENTDVSQNK